jgi:hypothetical protein
VIRWRINSLRVTSPGGLGVNPQPPAAQFVAQLLLMVVISSVVV